MTLERALRLREGDHVTHLYSAPSNKPLRITAVWVNAKRSIVCVRLASIEKTAWLDATGYEPIPDGKGWCEKRMEWIARDACDDDAPRKGAGFTYQGDSVRFYPS